VTSGGAAARVVFFGCYADGDGSPRPRLVRAAMERAGVEIVAECRADVVSGRKARYRSPLRAGLSILRALPSLARLYRRAPAHDVVYVGPGGFLEAVVLRRFILGRRGAGGPSLVFDPLYSLHDTVVSDRELVARGGLRARALARLEAAALAAADRVLVDTDATGDHFARQFSMPRGRFRRFRVGSIYGSSPPAARAARRFAGAPLDVLYVGSYIPLHGLDVVMAAALRLRHAGVRFTLVGSGQEERRVAAAVRERALRHVKLAGGFVGGDALRDLYARSDAALGIFGTSDKAQRVVPFKVNDAMALGLPLVTADTPAAREVLVNEESALLVPPGNPEILASALLRLRDDTALRVRLARGARLAFEAVASEEAAAFEIQVALEGLVGEARPPEGVEEGAAG